MFFFPRELTCWNDELRIVRLITELAEHKCVVVGISTHAQSDNRETFGAARSQ